MTPERLKLLKELTLEADREFRAAVLAAVQSVIEDHDSRGTTPKQAANKCLKALGPFLR